ncbi:MAG: hypothetical protein KJ574_03545 [Nanoarchaeota archaeon]|nr:hypothetical protein [Nanoarchaeota archaeon]
MNPNQAEAIRKAYKGTPALPGDQRTLIIGVYGPFMRGKPIENMPEDQVYRIADRLVREAYKLTPKNEPITSQREMRQIDMSSLGAWAHTIRREAGLSEDEQSFNPEESAAILSELARRRHIREMTLDGLLDTI